MKAKPLTLALALFPAIADAATRFDGAWTTIVSCPAASDAMGYAYDFPTQIKDGVLHGEHGQAGEPGRLTLDGPIEPNGQAVLYASGLVGARQFAVGQQPKGTSFGYHVKATFADAKGAGARVEGRPCALTFERR